jgi:hypothetical protein
LGIGESSIYPLTAVLTQTAMKKINLLLLIIYFSLINYADAQLNLKWAYSLGSMLNYHAVILSSAVSMDNSIVACGDADSTVDFDPGPGMLNLDISQYGYFISKYDTGGNVLFAKPMYDTTAGSAPSGGFLKVICDNNNNFYLIIGIYAPSNNQNDFVGIGFNISGVMNYDSIPKGKSRYFLVKFDGNGNCLYMKKMALNIEVDDAIIDNDDNLIICGYFSGSKDLAPGTPVQIFTAAEEDAFVTKLDSTGNISFIKLIHCEGAGAGYAYIAPHSLTSDSQNNIFFVAELQGIYDLDPGIDSNIVTAPYCNGSCVNYLLEKLDSFGNFIYMKKFFQNGIPISLKADLYDNIYLWCDTSISKYHNNGNLIFLKDIGNKVDIYDLQITKSNKFFLYGATADSVGFALLGIPSVGQTIGNGKKVIIQADSLLNGYYFAEISNSFDSTSWYNSILSDIQDNIYLFGYYAGLFDADFNAGTYNLENPYANPLQQTRSCIISKYQTAYNPNYVFGNNGILNFSILPNPFTSEITIAFQNQNIKQIALTIKNIFGQTIFTEQENYITGSYTKKVDVSLLSKGIYLLDVIIDGERTVKKIVKE